jgi:hypothetical protein
MARDLGVGRELGVGVGGQLVYPAHEPRTGRHGLTAQAKTIVRQRRPFV